MPVTKPKSELALAREGKVGKISIIGDIGWDYFGMDYKGFKNALNDLGDVNIIELEINSPGGIITDGVAMVNALNEHPATVHTYNAGEAASMGSVLLLAGDRAFIPDNAMTFIHKPLNMTIGNADDMRKMADELDKFEKAISASYMKHYTGSAEELTTLVAAETWYNAEEVAERFSNVTVIDSGAQDAFAHSDPVEILGDIIQHQETILDKAVNAVRNRVTGNASKEVDMPMSPEEKQEVIAEVSAEVTTSIIASLKEQGIISEPEAKVDEEVADEVAITFDGDMDDPDAVKAHQEKLAKAQLQASVDWQDVSSVAAYHEAISSKEDEAPAQPGSNASAQATILGNDSEEYSVEDIEAAVNRMTH